MLAKLKSLQTSYTKLSTDVSYGVKEDNVLLYSLYFGIETVKSALNNNNN